MGAALKQGHLLWRLHCSRYHFETVNYDSYIQYYQEYYGCSNIGESSMYIQYPPLRGGHPTTATLRLQCTLANHFKCKKTPSSS